MTAPCIVMAGGGTGGHVFPMIAVAEALRALRPDLELVFVGTAKGLERKLVPEHGFRLRLVDILPLRGAGVAGAVRGAERAVRATLEERRFLAKLQPRAVFSIGGYAAGPVALAARSLGVPVAVMEPNSVIGLSNRILAPFVQRAYIAFPAARRHFPRERVLCTGVPIREQFRALTYQPASPRSVLVLGGSQGARSLNEVLPQALARLPFAVRVVHQCGTMHAEALRSLYQSLPSSLSVEVVPFIDDMPAALAASDLVVSRSGASAVSEICATGRASVLVPYPHAAGDHQRKNAESLVEGGAALCVHGELLSAATLAPLLAELLNDAPRLVRMAEAARALGRPDAARVVAEDLLSLAGLSDSLPQARPNHAQGDAIRGMGSMSLASVASGRAY